jgi:tripartite ATP-independent transporter DctM subunit
MLKYKYHPELATGTVAVAGTIGALIPPSIILIIYAVIAQVSVSQLFLGGVVAGLLTAAGYIAVVLIRVWLNPDLAPERERGVTWGAKFRALLDTWPILLIMLGIFGGMFGGIFTPPEAAAVGAFLACIVAIVMREMTLARFLQAARETLMTTAALLIIAVGASMLTRFLALSGAGDYLSTGILSIAENPVLLMLGIVLVYLLMGLFLEPIGAMLLTLPIILPVVDAAGWDLIWFGIVLTKLLEIGMITPPIGINLFVIRSVAPEISMKTILNGMGPFITVDLMRIVLLAALPVLSLWLPNLLF